MPETPPLGDRDARLERVLADYLHAAEAGRADGRDALLRDHPDLADDLRSFFRNRDAIAGIVGPRGGPLPDTVGPERRVGGTGAIIRYFGDYELLGEIARGGMGVVYRARQVSLDRVVAVKMILDGELATASGVQRFRREAEAVGNLDHPNIVPIYETGEYDGRHYFSMKLIEGGSLAERIPDYRRDRRAAARLLATAARGVHYAHQRGVLHRDLKPANILLDGAGRPHITDFGLAKRVGGDRGETRSGSVVGTPSYMAPEQARASKDLSVAVDVYSLGAVFYELLTGRPPFRADTPLATLTQVTGSEPERPRRLEPAVDSDLETVCLKCLEKDPRRRYDSAALLADDLDRWLRGEAISARPARAGERLWRWCRRNPVIAGLTAAVFLALAAGAVVSAYLGAEANFAANRAEDKAAEAEEQRERADGEARRALALAGEEKQAREAAGRSEARARESEKQARINEGRAVAEKGRADDLLRLAEMRLYAGQLAHAQREWKEGNGARARQILEGCQWDLRDVEFRALWTRYTSDSSTLDGRTRSLTGVAFSPDGKRLVSASFFEGLRVWDIPTRRVAASVSAGWSSQIGRVAFSPGGKSLAHCQQRNVHVSDAASGRRLFSVAGGGGVAFSPDGKRFVSGTNHKVAKVWDASAGKELLTLAGHARGVIAVAYRPDGRRIVTGSSDHTAKVWDAATGKGLLTLKGHASSVTGVAFAPDGRTVVSASGDGTLKVWDGETGREIRTLRGHAEAVECVAVSPDGRLLASGSAGGALELWDSATGKEIRSLRPHRGALTDVAFSPDARSLASVGADGMVQLRAVEPAPEVRTLRGNTKPVTCVAVSPDGKRIAGGGNDRTVKVWDAETGRVIRTLTGRAEATDAVAFSPDGKRIAGTNWGGTLRVWDAETGRAIHESKLDPSAGSSLAFGPDGRRIVVADFGAARVWDAETGKSLVTTKGGHTMGVDGVAFSPDGKVIATASLDWAVKLWDARTGAEIRTLRGHSFFVHAVAFSPDGNRLVSGSKDTTVKVWDVLTGKEVRTLRGHTKAVRSVAYSPDGERILSGGGDDSVKVWDASTGVDLLTLRAAGGPVSGVAFGPDGDRIAAAAGDAVELWDAWSAPRSLPLGEGDVVATGFAFSPDGGRIATGHLDSRVKVWDARKGRALLTLVGHPATPNNGVTGLGFSPDGRRITGRDQAGKVLTWDATTGEVLPGAKPAAVTERQARSVAFGPDGRPGVTLDDDGKVRVVRLPVSAPARARQRGRDAAFAAALVRPDPAYHRRLADAGEKAGDEFAAAFHLRRLLRIEPTDAVRKRLAAVEASLAERPAKMPPAP